MQSNIRKVIFVLKIYKKNKKITRELRRYFRWMFLTHKVPTLYYTPSRLEQLLEKLKIEASISDIEEILLKKFGIVKHKGIHHIPSLTDNLTVYSYFSSFIDGYAFYIPAHKFLKPGEMKQYIKIPLTINQN